MADSYLTTVEGGVEQATFLSTDIGAGKVRLGDGSFTPDVNTLKAALVAAETTLTGYPAGGYPVTAMVGPIPAADADGVVITTPLITPLYASGGPFTVGFAWLESATGEVIRLRIFDPPKVLAAIPDGFEFIIEVPFGQN